MLKNGSKGTEVTELQQKLQKLGFDIQADGMFGPGTEGAVRKLQTLFNYTVDGIAGPGTLKLIEAQIGYGWNVTHPDAATKAAAANPKG